MSVLVATFYHFAVVEDCAILQKAYKSFMQQHDVKGTILVTPEGLNATIAGPDEGVHATLAMLRADPRFATLTHKESRNEVNPFTRTKVKLKPETIPMGTAIDPTQAGTYLNAQQWNELLQNPNVILVDSRNDYEVAIGKFKGAQNPNTRTFRELPAWLDSNLTDKKIPVAMYCTGGIRCEKSTAYLKQRGYENVYHLEGGILKYLEETPQDQSLWQGDCYVFDDRVAVRHDLSAATEYQICKLCNKPVIAADVRGAMGNHTCRQCTAEARTAAAKQHEQPDALVL